jgi:hypothetical protein
MAKAYLDGKFTRIATLSEDFQHLLNLDFGIGEKVLPVLPMPFSAWTRTLARRSSTERASSLSGCLLCRYSPAIRTGCAKERSSGSGEGLCQERARLSAMGCWR